VERSLGVFSSSPLEAGALETGPLDSIEPAESANAVVVGGLTYTRAGRAVFDGLDMSVPVGSRYALTGGNGAGKSALLRLIAGHDTPGHGTIEIFGMAPGPASAAETGVAVPLDLSGTGRAALAGIDDADDAGRRVTRALKRVGLADRADLPASAYTSGDLRRLTIASALVAPRALVLLDDPFTGLDTEGVADVVRLCGELSDDGVTLVLAARPHPALDGLATHVGMLDAGRLTAEGTAEDVRAANPTGVVVRTRDVILALGVLRGLGVADLTAHRDYLTATLGPDTPIDRVIRVLVHGGVRVTSVTPTPPPYAGP
jgi:ABC-2 type transport system ATP-binding protein